MEQSTIMSQVWHNSDSLFHKTLIVQDGNVYLGSASEERAGSLDSLLSSGTKPMLLLGDEAIQFKKMNIIQIHSNVDGTDIDFKYKSEGSTKKATMGFEEEEERDQALDAIENSLGLKRSREDWSRLRSVRGPVIAMIIFGVITYVLRLAAQDLVDNPDPEITGRRKMIKRIFVAVLDFFGPTGVTVIGAILIGLSVLVLFNRLKTPLSFIVLKK